MRSTKRLKTDVVVVGGGAAGMFAAGTAAELGLKVLILERNDRLGKKLYITGKGRCNVTNCCTAEEFLQNVPHNGRFLYSAASAFPPAAMMELLERWGCPLKTERGNRVFPVSNRSASIVDVLKKRLKQGGVRVETATVRSLLIEDGRVYGVETDVGERKAEMVLLCTGGCSYPLTGSDGSGYALARQVGAHDRGAVGLPGAAGGERRLVCKDAGAFSAERADKNAGEKGKGSL